MEGRHHLGTLPKQIPQSQSQEAHGGKQMFPMGNPQPINPLLGFFRPLKLISSFLKLRPSPALLLPLYWWNIRLLFHSDLVVCFFDSA